MKIWNLAVHDMRLDREKDIWIAIYAEAEGGYWRATLTGAEGDEMWTVVSTQGYIDPVGEVAERLAIEGFEEAAVGDVDTILRAIELESDYGDSEEAPDSD